MKITKLTEESYEVKGVTPAYINSIRRIMASQVPVMAIKNVEFKKNSSALYDEMLAHRLGLLVLTTDLKSYNMPGEVESAATHAKLTLKAKGPCNVYAKDITSSDKNIKPAHEKTLIVKLDEGQELEFVATATLGQGLEHMKWSPGLITYYYKPKITVNNKSKDFENFKQKYPPQIFKAEKIDEALINTPELIDACKNINKDIVNIEYKENQDEFILNIESWGQLKPKEIVEKAVEIFNEEIDEFKKALKNI
ncbi:MAG: DNA-directed RNA polymerase subunit D [Candidatus Woesearchaeota archaeon]